MPNSRPPSSGRQYSPDGTSNTIGRVRERRVLLGDGDVVPDAARRDGDAGEGADGGELRPARQHDQPGGDDAPRAVPDRAAARGAAR